MNHSEYCGARAFECLDLILMRPLYFCIGLCLEPLNVVEKTSASGMSPQHSFHLFEYGYDMTARLERIFDGQLQFEQPGYLNS